MTIAFQLAVFALIATSSILLISVPVVFASSDGWSSKKNVVFSGTSLWIGLVFLVAILNSLITKNKIYQEELSYLHEFCIDNIKLK
ncbi:putative photosystem II PsbZ, reaction centre, photosystem II PsbZ superfamily [Dioscorea sansibarensis]